MLRVSSLISRSTRQTTSLTFQSKFSPIQIPFATIKKYSTSTNGEKNEEKQQQSNQSKNQTKTSYGFGFLLAGNYLLIKKI